MSHFIALKDYVYTLSYLTLLLSSCIMDRRAFASNILECRTFGHIPLGRSNTET